MDTADGSKPHHGEASNDDGALNTERDGFIYLRLTGARFEDEGMPTGSVLEIQRLSEVMYAVARGIWLAQNPGRSRATGLRKAFELRLVSVEDGSARPVLRMSRPPATTADDEEDFTPIFVRARRELVSAVRAVASQEPVPESFPRTAVPALRFIGSTLQGGESLVMAPPRRPSDGDSAPAEAARAVITPAVHLTLKLIDAVLSEPGPGQFVGVIVEFDSARATFEARDEVGRKHTCTLAPGDPDVAEAAKAALATSRDLVTAPDVTIEGTGLRGADGQLGDLWDVHTVSVVRQPSEKVLMAKLAAIKALEPDWWGPGCERPDREALAVVERLVPDIARVAHVALTANADGAVVLEWRRGDYEFTVHVESGHRMFTCSDNVVTDDVDEYEGELDEDRLMAFVRAGAL